MVQEPAYVPLISLVPDRNEMRIDSKVRVQQRSGVQNIISVDSLPMRIQLHLWQIPSITWDLDPLVRGGRGAAAPPRRKSAPGSTHVSIDTNESGSISSRYSCQNFCT